MKKLVYLDYCYPDYFAGHPGPVLAVPVWAGMTKQDLVDAIRDEYWATDDSFPELNIETAITELLDGASDDPFPDAREETYLYLGVE